MDVRLLGALEVLDDDGEAVAVPGGKVRALLAILALRDGQVVATDELVEALWGDEPPREAPNTLQGLVSRLRRALGSAGVVVMGGSGYELRVGADAVDVGRAERLVAEGRRAAGTRDLVVAERSFVAAEELWRGVPLADFPYDEFAQAPRARLTELGVEVAEARIDAAMALGRTSGLVGDLEALVAAHPLREGLRGQLMVALYRAGRQADALRVFQEGRTILADELGLDPGPELRRIESAILAQDAQLDGPALAGARTGTDDERVPEPAVTGSASPSPVAGGPRSNVKVPATALVGRLGDLDEIAALLRDQRMVTVVGPGGAGKTRLAVEAARRAGDGFADGVWFVELASVRDAPGVLAAVASAISLPDARAALDDGVDDLAAHLRTHDVLLVLDNCEQVVDQVAAVADVLLGSCARLRILATSREAMRIPGEVAWAIPPLPIADAVELFAERARAVDTTFTLSDADDALAADICAHLDGLPLAIELAAARTRAFPIAQIADRLDDRFRLLTGGSRTAQPRQQTLRAVVDWSYDLLFEDERTVFERLSVLAGGCTLEAAEAVCSDDTIDRRDVADLLATLVAKSLVVADRSGSVTRYSMLETLRQYGRERLEDAGALDAVERRMVAYFADLCLRSRAAMIGHDQVGWLAAANTERDNLRAALDWAIAHDDAEVAAGVVTALGWFWYLTGRAVEGSRWIDEALSCTDPPLTSAHGFALMWRSHLGFLRGRREPITEALLEEIRASFRATGDDAGLGMSAFILGTQLTMRGEIERGVTLLTEALTIYEALPSEPWTRSSGLLAQGLIAEVGGDRAAGEALMERALTELEAAGDLWNRALVLYDLSARVEARGDYAGARARLDEIMAIARLLDFPGFLAGALARTGDVAMLAGDLAEARRAQEESLALAEQIAYTPVIARASNSIARRLLLEGRPDDAEVAALRAIEIYRGEVADERTPTSGYGFPPGAALSLWVLGRAASAKGDLDLAAERLEAALDVARTALDPRLVAADLEGLADVAVAQGDLVRAAALLGLASAQRSTVGAVPSAADHAAIETTRLALDGLLDPEARSVAFEAGRSASLDDLDRLPTSR